MPKVTICRIVVASPADVRPERNALPAVVAELPLSTASGSSCPAGKPMPIRAFIPKDPRD
jgi:hypothetical protein